MHGSAFALPPTNIVRAGRGDREYQSRLRRSVPRTLRQRSKLLLYVVDLHGPICCSYASDRPHFVRLRDLKVNGPRTSNRFWIHANAFHEAS
jgi:hypothetical protein